MILAQAQGKCVRITLKDGQVFEGRAYDYTSELDNEPDPESISIDGFELFVDEIEKIEAI